MNMYDKIKNDLINFIDSKIIKKEDVYDMTMTTIIRHKKYYIPVENLSYDDSIKIINDIENKYYSNNIFLATPSIGVYMNAELKTPMFIISMYEKI